MDNDTSNSMPRLPRVGFDVKVYESLTPPEKIKFLWQAFTKHNLDNNVNFVKGTVKTSLSLAKVIARNKEFKQYLSTLSTLVDMADLGFAFSNIFRPYQEDRVELEHAWVAPLFGTKIRADRIGKHTQLVSSLLADYHELSNDLLEQLGISRLPVPESFKIPEHVYSDKNATIRLYSLNSVFEPYGKLLKPLVLVFVDYKEDNTFGAPADKRSLFYDLEALIMDADGNVENFDVVAYLGNIIEPRAFMSSMDFSTHFLSISFSAAPKRVSLDEMNVPYEVRVPDLGKLSTCYQNVKEKGRKWGVALIGDAGVGKTGAVKKFCSMHKGAPIFWMEPGSLQHMIKVENVFHLASSMPGSIIVIDDLDSGDSLATKTEVVGNLIQKLALKNNKFFLIATINDPNRVDSTLLDRAERFDEVVQITRPDESEIGNIIEHLENGIVVEDNKEKRKSLVRKMVEGNLTHVQVASVYNRASLYVTGTLTYSDLEESLSKVVESSKNAYLRREKGVLVAD